jgi:hypothetical protein
MGHDNSEVVELDGRKRQISSDSYRSTKSKLNFHKYGNVINFKERFLIQVADSSPHSSSRYLVGRAQM